MPPPLIVGTGGLEVEMVAAGPFGSRRPHIAQSWKPIECLCGHLHEPCDDAWYTIMVGGGQESVHGHPDVPTFSIVPRNEPVVRGNLGCLRAHPGADFGPWARGAVRHLLDPLVMPGLICVDMDQIIAILKTARSSYFDSIKGVGDMLLLVDELCARPFWPRPRGGDQALLVGINGGTKMALAALSDATKQIEAWTTHDTNLVFYSAMDPDLAPDEKRISMSVGPAGPAALP